MRNWLIKKRKIASTVNAIYQSTRRRILTIQICRGAISSIEEDIEAPTNLATKLMMFAASIAMIAGVWSMKTSSVAGSGDAVLAWLFIFAGLIFLKITSEETDDF